MSTKDAVQELAKTLSGLSDKELDDQQDDWQRELREEDSALEARAKPKEELVYSVIGRVTSFDGTQISVDRAIARQWRAGGRDLFYDKGDRLTARIGIETTDTPVKILEVRGWPYIRAGDIVRAYIFSGEIEQAKLSSKEYLVERELMETESPIKLEVLVDGSVAATYHFEE